MMYLDSTTAFPQLRPSTVEFVMHQPRLYFDERIKRDIESVRRADRRNRLSRLVELLHDAKWVHHVFDSLDTIPFVSAESDLVTEDTVFFTLHLKINDMVDVQVHQSGEAFFAYYQDNRSIASGSGSPADVTNDILRIISTNRR